METKPVEQAIALLQDTQKQVYELLEPFSGLYLRTDHFLTILINGLIFAVKQTNIKDEGSRFNPISLASLYQGQKDLSSPVTTTERLIALDHEALDKLRQKAAELYTNFCKRADKDILEACNSLEIRAVAKLAGIDPMDHPEQMNHAFISSIKEAITKKETEQKAMEDWLAKQEVVEEKKEEKESITPPATQPTVNHNKVGQASKKATIKK